IYCNLGHVTQAVNDLSKDSIKDKNSLEWYKKSIDTLEAVRGRAAQNARAREFLANAYRGRMVLHLRCQRRVEALRDLRRAAPLERGKFVVLLPELAKKVIDEMDPFEAARVCAFFAA